MKRFRIVPTLLVQDGGLVKSIKFKNHTYVGDPINAVKIFNDKEVDEIVVMDISATSEKRSPNIAAIKEIASEAFMPLAYGGGITTVAEIQELIASGVEKVILNTAAFRNPSLVTQAAAFVGRQSIVVAIDVKKTIWGKLKVFTNNGTKNTNRDPVEYSILMQHAGAGELLVNSIDRDGTFEGYDLELIEAVSKSVSIPIVASGGASTIEDFRKAVDAGASAAAAGSLFVFQRPHRAVLISYPDQKELEQKVFLKS